MSTGATPKGLFIPVFGLGGTALDPGGQAQFIGKAKARRLECPDVAYQYTDTQAIQATILSFARRFPHLPIFSEGDSCGANVQAQILANCAPIKLDLVGCVQASQYCNFNYPNIGANCKRIMIFYSSWVLTGGLGVFIPQPASVPTSPVVRGDWHIVNGGSTLYQARYVPAPHPDDQDVTNVQNPFFSVVDAILTDSAGQA